jgi:hypothetical protein
VMKSDEILIKTFDQVKNDNFDQVKFDQVIVCHLDISFFRRKVTFLYLRKIYRYLEIRAKFYGARMEASKGIPLDIFLTYLTLIL